MEHLLRNEKELVASRDTREVSEKIVELLTQQDYTAEEQKQILNNARNYLVEIYSEKRDKADKEMHYYKMEIETLVSK